jgi:hypothetical protein
MLKRKKKQYKRGKKKLMHGHCVDSGHVINSRPALQSKEK